MNIGRHKSPPSIATNVYRKATISARQIILAELIYIRQQGKQEIDLGPIYQG